MLTALNEDIGTSLKISSADTIDIPVYVPCGSCGQPSMFVDGVSNRDCMGLGRRDELVGVHRLLAWVVLVSPRCECAGYLGICAYAKRQYFDCLYPLAARRAIAEEVLI